MMITNQLGIAGKQNVAGIAEGSQIQRSKKNKKWLTTDDTHENWRIKRNKSRSKKLMIQKTDKHQKQKTGIVAQGKSSGDENKRNLLKNHEKF